MDQTLGDLETSLPDLGTVDLRALSAMPSPELDAVVRQLLRAIEDPDRSSAGFTSSI